MNTSLVQRVARTDATEILVGSEIYATDSFPRHVNKAVFLIDQQVGALHEKRLKQIISSFAREAYVEQIQAGEAMKSLEKAATLMARLEELDMAKQDFLVCIGGGTITDLGGFVSQMMFRGVPLVLIPTTLLAQIDAAIGGKNGLNLGGKKNRLGSFYFPRLVACDTGFLGTLSERQLRSGLAEAIKVFAVSDANWCHKLANRYLPLPPEGCSWAELVAGAIQAKLNLLAEDPIEISPNRLLNFGHTFAHFLEEESVFKLFHGEAVMLSMLWEVMIGSMAEVCPTEVFEKFYQLVAPNFTEACWRLQMQLPKLTDVLLATRRLRGGKDHLVVLQDLGHATTLPEVPPSLAKGAWKALRNRMNERI